MRKFRKGDFVLNINNLSQKEIVEKSWYERDFLRDKYERVVIGGIAVNASQLIPYSPVIRKIAEKHNQLITRFLAVEEQVNLMSTTKKQYKKVANKKSK
jgi:hypothetical protein